MNVCSQFTYRENSNVQLFPLLIQSGDVVHWTVAPMYQTTPACSFKHFWKHPFGQIQSCASMVSLSPISLTLTI